MSRIKKTLYLLIPFIFFIVILIGIEITIRKTSKYIPSINYFLDSENTHAESKGGKNLFEGDPLLGWRLISNVDRVWWDYTQVSTNSDHLRQNEDISEKRKGVFRIICLGDSVTFGYRSPVAFLPYNKERFNSNQLSYPEYLKELLKKRYKNRNFEIINLAVPGYSSHQGLLWIKRDFEKLKPDLVIANFGWNDADLSRIEDKMTLTDRFIDGFAKEVISNSQALIRLSKTLKYFKKQRLQKIPKLSSRVKSADYLSNMYQIAEVSRKHGSRVLIVGQVFQNFKDFQKRIKVISRNRENLKEMCLKNSVTYLEIEKLTERSHETNSSLFGETIHPNYLGYQLMAKEIANYLEIEKLL